MHTIFGKCCRRVGTSSIPVNKTECFDPMLPVGGSNSTNGLDNVATASLWDHADIGQQGTIEVVIETAVAIALNEHDLSSGTKHVSAEIIGQSPT